MVQVHPFVEVFNWKRKVQVILLLHVFVYEDNHFTPVKSLENSGSV